MASHTTASSQREEEEDEEKQETRAFFFEHVSRRAQRDSELQDKDEELECIKQQGRQIRSKGPDTALDVAARLAEMGNCCTVWGIHDDRQHHLLYYCYSTSVKWTADIFSTVNTDPNF